MAAAIYNAVDARARAIKVWVNASSGSFSVADDGKDSDHTAAYTAFYRCLPNNKCFWVCVGDGMPPEGLFKYIGEYVATSRLAPPHSNNDARSKQGHYGYRGEFLHALGTLASVEIESRVQDQWTAHRKLIQEGAVAFNARSKVFRKGHGTTLTARKLFNCLPVRAKDLQNNSRYCAKLVKEIQTFCVNLSMIWPTLSLELVFENNARQSLRISGVNSCRERFAKVFGSAIGNELEYMDFSPVYSQFAVRGYFALIQDSWEVSPAGLKQARAYYQYVFFQNQWIESFHHECVKRITRLALELDIGIPIFVLKVDCPSAESALLWSENGKCVEFKSPQSLDQLLRDLMQTLKGSVDSASNVVAREQDTPTVRMKDELMDLNEPSGEDDLWSEEELYQLPDDGFEESVPYYGEESKYDVLNGQLPASYLPSPFEHAALRNNDLVLYEMQTQGQKVNGFHQACPDGFLGYSEDGEEETNQRFSIPPQENEMETIFLVQDARTNWGEFTPARDDAADLNVSISGGADLCPSCESCGHVNTWRGSAQGDLDDEGWGYDGEYKEAESDFDISPIVLRPHERQAIDIDDSLLETHEESKEPQLSKTRNVHEGELANVFFTDSKVPKLAGATKNQASEENSTHGHMAQHWITSRSLKTEFDGALESSPLHQRFNATPQSVNSEKRPSQLRSKYFSASEAEASPVAPAMKPRKSRTFSMTLPRTSKCTLRVDNVGEPKQLRNFKIPKSVLDTLEVIRQVDRKFILVRVTDHSSFESLLLCIDQHAADERVKLEQLELELFGPGGDELNIKVSENTQPQLILLNAKEARTLTANEDIVRVWGFDFEFLERETESSRFTTSLYTSMEYGSTGEDGEYYVELRATPKVDTRSANTDDFREFIQILSQNEGFWSWTVMRPPVITRLLHSRACRSAIMFGDYLSVSQCRELVDDLRKCKLPFQCAHGRPSVVPLVEFISR